VVDPLAFNPHSVYLPQILRRLVSVGASGVAPGFSNRRGS